MVTTDASKPTKTYNLRMVPTSTEVVFCGYDYVGKADLSKGYWYPKIKFGVPTISLVTMKQQLF